MEHEATCPRCDGDGAYDLQLAGRSHDEEPRYERRPCKLCDGSGVVTYDDRTAELIEEFLASARRENANLRQVLRDQKGRTHG